MIGFVGNPSHFEDRFGDQIVIRFVRFFYFFSILAEEPGHRFGRRPEGGRAVRVGTHPIHT